jgi:autotransporter-associated beta strand protein
MSRGDLWRVVVALGLVTFGFVGDRADAQTWTGAGVDSNWGTGGNWSTSLAGATVSALTFTGSTAVNSSTNNLVTTVSGSIAFSNTAGGTASAVTLAGTGTVSLTAATPIYSVSTAANVTDEIGFPIKLSGGNKTFNMGSAHNLRITNVISEDGSARNLTKGGQGGTLILSGENLFTGQLQVNVGNVQTDRLENVSDPSPLGAGNLPVRIGNGATAGTLIYTGIGETTNRYIQVGGGAASTATGGATVTQNGSGPLVFTATSAFNTGTFNVPQTGIDPAVSRFLTLNGTNTDLNTINGKIVNNVNVSAGASLVALTKSGAGTWVLAGANDYTGGTTVSNGILYVNGSLANGNSNSVASGATLGGTGVIGAATTLSGRLAPGFGGIGTLSFSNGVTWNGGATSGTATDWLYDLGASNASDLVSITGNFTKGTGAAFRFDLGNATSQGIYTLASWTGSTTFSTGDFTYTNLGGGNTGTFDIVGSSLVLTIVPEPTTTIGLIASGVAGLFAARRGRRRNF